MKRKEVAAVIKVSVIVPVYNAEPYLKKCLSSLIHQTLKEIEIICVNDGSADRSLEILKKYAAADRRVRVIDKKNAGYGHTVNIGMDAALGRYAGIVEPDDYVRPDMYRRLYETAVRRNLDIMKADFYRFWSGGKGRKFRAQYHPLSKEKSYYRRVIDPKQDMGIFKADIHTWAGIYKLDFLRKHQIRHHETPGASYQDNGFWFRTLCLAERVYFLDEPYYMYRMDNPGSSVHSSRKVYSICEEYDDMRAFLEQNEELKRRYLPVWSWKRFHNYQYNLERIGREHQEEFMKRYSMDFARARAEGELPREYFTFLEWRMINQIIDAPDRYLKKFRKYGDAWYRVQYELQNCGVKVILKKAVRRLLLQ